VCSRRQRYNVGHASVRQPEPAGFVVQIPAMPADRLDDTTLGYLRALSKLYPSSDSVLVRMAHLNAVLALPKGTVHVVSDVHGEFKKLKHIVNNASGSLRPLVEETFGERLSASEKLEFLNLVYYPRETFEHIANAAPEMRRELVHRFVHRAFELLGVLSRRYSIGTLEKVIPEDYRPLFREMLFESQHRGDVERMIDTFIVHRRELPLVRIIARVIRNLLVWELIVAGDLGDRGPRIDLVIDFIRRQPNVAISWGNHDVVWMGACLGEETCLATVLRISLRYGRLAQLEEGYGIPLAPLEKLARSVYADDPAERFKPKGPSSRDALLVARMQKAIAVIQFKLEEQLIARNPDFEMEHRALLGRIDPRNSTLSIGGAEHALLDTRFPTVDWNERERLSDEERACILELQRSFVFSPVLWEHMRLVARKGAMMLRRDDNLIFHGCVPVDGEGRFLEQRIDGVPRAGRALFEAYDLVVQRAFRGDARREDLDQFYYLWAGPRSPLFGKDKMTTFEQYFVADKALHKETKNPYFKLIHEREFCERIFRELGVSSGGGVIVNGHVPVKIEEGESPLKRSGVAVTIDGAFSEAYGDKGYTLVLDSDRTYVAQHHHFESIEAAITEGADIIPKVQEIRRHDPPRTVGDTEQGAEIRHEIEMLELLLRAYEDNRIPETLE